MGTSARSLNLRHNLFAQLILNVREDDRCSFSGENPRRRGANPPGAARDDANFVL
jgi:hypothetical protein